MKDETFKQNLVGVARGYVVSLFYLAICRDPISSELRFCRTAVAHRRNSDVDDGAI